MKQVTSIFETRQQTFIGRFRTVICLMFFSLSAIATHAQKITPGNYYQQNSAYQFSSLLVEKVFNGGTNLRSDVYYYDYANGIKEVKIHMTFNGNYVSSNFYETTIVFSNEAPFVRLENTNGLAAIYLTYVGLQEAKELFNELNNDQNESYTTNN